MELLGYNTTDDEGNEVSLTVTLPTYYAPYPTVWQKIAKNTNATSVLYEVGIFSC